MNSVKRAELLNMCINLLLIVFELAKLSISICLYLYTNHLSKFDNCTCVERQCI